jgi:hypothetical protein
MTATDKRNPFSMSSVPFCFLLLLLFTLPSCAIGEIMGGGATATPTVIPVLIPPPPPQVVGEACSIESRNLESYLQAVTTQTTLFREELANARTQTPEERAVTTIGLAALRDEAFRTSTPECAIAAQSMLTAAMNRAVELLRASLIDPVFNLDVALEEVDAMMTQADDLQKALVDSFEAQIEALSGE